MLLGNSKSDKAMKVPLDAINATEVAKKRISSGAIPAIQKHDGKTSFKRAKSLKMMLSSPLQAPKDEIDSTQSQPEQNSLEIFEDESKNK